MASENNKFAISNLFNVEGWVCVVTGGGTGIGLMIAQAFANNGAKVYITSRRREVLERTEKEWRSSFPHLQGKLIPVVCDITSKDSIRRLVDEIGKKEDHVDLLVNNAGSLGSKESETQGKNVEALARDLFDDDPAQWEDIYKTNVIGAYFVSTAFLPLLHAATKRRHNHTGCIINISSIAGITRHPLDHIKYNASKAAFIQLSTMLAQICRSEAVQIRVNNIAPGRFPTAMTVGSSDESNKSTDVAPYLQQMRIPAGRLGRDEDIAQTALMLACNQYAYGQTIVIDGAFILAHG